MSFFFSAASDASDKVKPEIPPYTGLPSLDNIPSVADLTASMAKKKEEKRMLEEKRKEEERRVSSVFGEKSNVTVYNVIES